MSLTIEKSFLWQHMAMISYRFWCTMFLWGDNICHPPTIHEGGQIGGFLQAFVEAVVRDQYGIDGYVIYF